MKLDKKILQSIGAILAANMSAVMDIANAGSSYNGTVVADLYKVLITGNDVLAQGTARVEQNIRTTRSLPRISSTINPIGAYEVTPSGVTTTTTYEERTLAVNKAMIYDEFDPNSDDWADIWDQWAATGQSYTNIVMNPNIMNAVFMLYQNKAGNQMAREFWSGTTAGAVDRIDGIITLALLDASVVDVTNIGVITPANVIQVFTDVWTAVPDQFFNDPNYNIHCKTSVYKMLQLANQTAAATTSGYLNNAIQNLFLEQKIKHYADFPANSVLAGKGTTGTDSNFVWGFYATPDKEMSAPRIDRVSNNSELWFTRINYKYGVQYREGSEIILYTGV